MRLVNRIRLATLLFAMLVASCAVVPVEPPVSEVPAVRALVEQARTDTVEGRYTDAAAGIERALRIESRNPRLWQELARVRLAQGDGEQAEGLAKRANALAGSDRRLRAANWRLIGEARILRGDTAGAAAAAAQAASLER